MRILMCVLWIMGRGERALVIVGGDSVSQLDGFEIYYKN